MTSAQPFLFAGKRHRSRPGGLWVLALLVGSLGLQPAWSGSKDDHNRARQAVQAGQVLPLRSMLERLEREHPGQVMEVELEQQEEDGRWIYEVKLLQPQGQLVKLKLDARTAALLPAKGNSKSDERRTGRDARP
ncbi:MAG: peptidase [Polaromonas sp.]|uniref:PepSY domain-containing protein n=1 Tax=Polaromonas sp. TaxID=1869339 RepID=UPI00248A38F5|nr:PepSY domain-containing protein [Polaromonas sp.]MDI1240166.1 peptidase [Polaromonas sp.]MDI1338629.1 peptidase [Polaromonas sp.]